MQQVDFANEHIGRSIVSTTLPMLAAQVISLLYNIVDRIYIGRLPLVGREALGGVGLCFPVIVIILAFTNLYGMGGAPLTAIERGKGKPKKAEEIMNTAFFLMVCTGIVLTLLGELLAEPILYAFGASSENILYGLPYLRIYLIGTIPAMLATGLNPYINAQGFPRVGMLSVLIGAGLNMILDPILMFPLAMGVRGAAVATIVSQCASAVFVLTFLRGKKAELHLSMPSFAMIRERGTMIANIISLGMASFIMQVTNSLVTIVCNKVLSFYGGSLYISIMTVISSVRQILDTPVLAVSEGTSPIISYNYGANNPKNVRRAMLIMSIMGISYTLLMWILILLQPSMFIRIFSSDEDVLRFGAPALHTYFFAFIFQALQYSGQGTFKALGKKKHTIFFSLFRKVIMVVPLTILLPRIGGIGVNGVFLAEPISNLVGGTACFVTMLFTVLPELKRMEQ